LPRVSVPVGGATPCSPSASRSARRDQVDRSQAPCRPSGARSTSVNALASRRSRRGCVELFRWRMTRRRGRLSADREGAETGWVIERHRHADLPPGIGSERSCRVNGRARRRLTRRRATSNVVRGARSGLTFVYKLGPTGGAVQPGGKLRGKPDARQDHVTGRREANRPESGRASAISSPPAKALAGHRCHGAWALGDVPRVGSRPRSAARETATMGTASWRSSALPRRCVVAVGHGRASPSVFEHEAVVVEQLTLEAALVGAPRRR
jgi:hypothetical protein